MNATTPRRSRAFGLIAIAAIVLVALVVWFQRGGSSASSPSDVTASDSPPARPSPPSGPAPALAGVEPAERSAVETKSPAPSAPAEPAPPSTAEAPEMADLDARDWLGLRVVDEREQPIFDAEVEIRGLRKEGDEGSWYSRRDGESKVRTGRDGRARVDYERWTDIDGKTVRVDLVVTHADFIPFNENSFVLAPGEQTIVLKQGTTLWVTAWHGSRDRVVADVVIGVEWEAQLGKDGWTRERDGSWSTARLAPGPHWITVTHESAELGKLASDFTPFELAEHARLDLALELKPLIVLRGRLDDSVPRPIVDGHVQVNLHASTHNMGLHSDHEALVAADGTFTLEGLRAASGQVIAVCDGWVSKQVPPRTLEEARVGIGADATEAQRSEALARARESASMAQPVDAVAGVELVVEMEPTGTLEVRVVDEQGAPIPSAYISASPNVQWLGVGARIFPWHEWSAIADETGVARIAQLPPDDSLWFSASAAGHQMRKADRDRMPSAVIESGKVTRVELVLEKRP